MYAQDEWVSLLIAISFAGGAFIAGACFQLMNARLFVPRHYELLHSAIMLFTAVEAMLGVLFFILFFYSQIYAVSAAERRQALILVSLCNAFFAIIVTWVGLIVGIALYHARTVPRLLSRVVIVVMVINLPISFYSLNPDLPAYRVTLGLPLASIIPILFTAYCFILAKAIETAEITRTPVTQ